jgi:type VI protein secretion system component Hcp
MTKNQNAGGNMLGRILLGSAIMVLMVGVPLFMASTTWAAVDTFIRITGLDGSSKDAAHPKWIEVSSVVAGDLNGDAMADRESSAPSVSEVTAKPTGAASGSAADKSKSASDSWSTPTGKAAIGSSSSGAGAGKLTASDAASALPSGKRMHKPFTIRKEVDSASPLLYKACASGQHFAELDVDLASGEKYKLTDVLISSDQKSSGGDRPTESITFTYQKIEMSH